MVQALLLNDYRPVSPSELTYNIQVGITTRPRRDVDNSTKINNRCLSRIPLIGLTSTTSTTTSVIGKSNEPCKSSHLPCFLLCNVRSLMPKIDELTATIKVMSPDVVATTKTWLHELHHSNSFHIPGFSLRRRDRPIGRGGGVCVYISNTIPSKRRFDLENPLYECMWIW